MKFYRKIIKTLNAKRSPKRRLSGKANFRPSSPKALYCLLQHSVDDMHIFGTNQMEVDKTKEFLSTKFSMKDLGEADVILGIRIKRDGKGLTLTQSHYIEKVVKRFQCDKSTPVSTPMDPSENFSLT